MLLETMKAFGITIIGGGLLNIDDTDVIAYVYKFAYLAVLEYIHVRSAGASFRFYAFIGVGLKYVNELTCCYIFGMEMQQRINLKLYKESY